MAIPTKNQQLNGFRQKIFSLDDLIRISKGKYLTKYDARYGNYLFLLLNPDSPRLYTQYISKDNVSYKPHNKLSRHTLLQIYKISAKDIDKIIDDPAKIVPE